MANFKDFMKGGWSYPVGGSGGVSSWNDLTDKPFYEDVENGYIFPEATLETVDGGVIIENPLAGEFILGEEYAVNWNGTVYNCVAQEADLMGNICTGLGNVGVMVGGEPSSEPFVFLAVPPEMAASAGGPGMIMALDGSETITISVYGPSHILKQIDPKFIPKSATDNVFLAKYELMTGNLYRLQNCTSAEIQAAVISGKQVLLSDGDRNVNAALSKMYSDRITFVAFDYDGANFDVRYYEAHLDNTITLYNKRL